MNNCSRIAPTIDLVLLSHGDLAHCGLYPWAYSRWGLTAPAYTTLPVQAMGRIAVTEDIEGIRSEIAVDIEEPEKEETEKPDEGMGVEEPLEEKPKPTMGANGKCVPTLIEVQDAFDIINTLRYSQPIHLQGASCVMLQLAPVAELTACREVPRSDHHPIQRGALPRWNNMEDSFPVVWYHPLCRQPEPHARTAFGWNGTHNSTRWRRRFRVFGAAGPADYRRGAGCCHYEQKEGQRCCFARYALFSNYHVLSLRPMQIQSQRHWNDVRPSCFLAIPALVFSSSLSSSTSNGASCGSTIQFACCLELDGKC